MHPDRDPRLYVEDMLAFCNIALPRLRGALTALLVRI
jgi:hypothetical protein